VDQGAVEIRNLRTHLQELLRCATSSLNNENGCFAARRALDSFSHISVTVVTASITIAGIAGHQAADFLLAVEQEQGPGKRKTPRKSGLASSDPQTKRAIWNDGRRGPGMWNQNGGDEKGVSSVI